MSWLNLMYLVLYRTTLWVEDGFKSSGRERTFCRVRPFRKQLWSCGRWIGTRFKQWRHLHRWNDTPGMGDALYSPGIYRSIMSAKHLRFGCVPPMPLVNNTCCSLLLFCQHALGFLPLKYQIPLQFTAEGSWANGRAPPTPPPTHLHLKESLVLGLILMECCIINYLSISINRYIHKIQ